MARDLAIDLGTANTLVYERGRGIVLNEPSVIALNSRTNEVLAMGHEAWQMIGRTPGYIVAVRPLRGGAITDFDITQRMIRLLLQRVGVNRFNRPRVVICVPSAITEVERRAVIEAARRAGSADALQQEADHPLGDVEVGDGAAAQRANGDDVAGSPTDHLPRLVAHRQHLVGAAVEGDDRGLVEDDPAVPLVDQGVGGAQVDGEVARHLCGPLPPRLARVGGAQRVHLSPERVDAVVHTGGLALTQDEDGRADGRQDDGDEEERDRTHQPWTSAGSRRS